MRRRWGLDKHQICAKISKHHDLQTNTTLIPSSCLKGNSSEQLSAKLSLLYNYSAAAVYTKCILILYLQSFDSILGGEPDISASPQAKNVDFLAVHPQFSHIISWLSCLMQRIVITALLMSYASLCAVVSRASYAILINVCILQIHFCKYV